MAVAPMTILASRAEVIDFTSPILNDHQGIMSKKEIKDTSDFMKVFRYIMVGQIAKYTHGCIILVICFVVLELRCI